MTILDAVRGIDIGHDTSLFRELVKTWSDRRPMNARRSRYRDGEQGLRDFGISIPPQMQNMGAALGWVGKGIAAVTDRSEFEGFVLLNGSSDDPLGLSEVLDANRFEQDFAAARASSATHGCSFTTVTRGDVQSGELPELIVSHAAEHAAGVWDMRRRDLAGFLAIRDTKGDKPTSLLMLTPESMYSITRDGNRWLVEKQRHSLGRVPAVPHVYGYDLTRPLGRSRITRASMFLTDAALRTISRSEVSAELYSGIQIYLWGPGVSDAIGSDKWKARMGMIHAFDLEPGDEKPELKHFAGSDPTPHIGQLRMLANLFADDLDLEVKFADTANPSSADAIFAAKETLITTTRRANRGWSYSGQQVAQFAVQLRDGYNSTAAREARQLRANFTDPAIVSPSARAAAFGVLADKIPGFGESEVGLEFSGLTREQIARFQSELSRNQAAGILERTLAAGGTPAPAGAGTTVLDEAKILDVKLDSLGKAVRAGVDPANAARLLGLEDVEFTGAVPVSLRLPTEEAAAVEDR